MKKGRLNNILATLSEAGFISGWDQIARFLGVPKRTLQRRWADWKLPIIFLGNGLERKRPVLWLLDFELWHNHLLKERLLWLEARQRYQTRKGRPPIPPPPEQLTLPFP